MVARVVRLRSGALPQGEIKVSTSAQRELGTKGRQPASRKCDP